MPVAIIESAQPGASRRDKAFNFVVFLVDSVGWPLGMAFFNVATILPVFLQRLGATNAQIGALPAIISLLTFAPGFLVASYVARLRTVRAYVWLVALVERFFLIPIVPLTYLWGPAHPHWLLIAFFVCFSLNTLLMGLNMPSYWVFVAKTVPTQWRGRLYGFAGGVAGVLGIGVEALLRRLLGGPDNGFPGGFAMGFLIGIVILMVSYAPLGLVREPEGVPPGEDDPHTGHYGRDSLRIWRTDASFRLFLGSQVVWALTAIAGPFFVLYARDTLHVSLEDVALYAGAMVLAPAFGSLLWGAWADKSGNKIVIIAASVCGALAPLLALLAHSVIAFLFVFVLTAMGSAGVYLAGSNVIMEYAGSPRDVPLYTAFYNLATSIPRAAAPLLGGVIADHAGGYRMTFAIAGICAAASLWLAFRLVEPRHNRHAFDGTVGHHNL